jgi:hypothetical protein
MTLGTNSLTLVERMPKTLTYSSKQGCPPGYRHRRGYTTKKGAYVKPICVKATSMYAKGSANLRSAETRRRSGLKGTKTALGLTKKCASGQILRAPYTRKFSRNTKAQGYNVKKGNKTYRVYPKSGSILVKAACIENRGLPGKGPRTGEGIAPLRKGELAKYGYNAHKTTEARHDALKKAIAVYGALGVFRKLDAVAKLTVRTAPEAHKIFQADRDWVRKNYPLKAFN